ncbi:adult-specific cuticular protein ACP-20-like [Pollicipes pollicipes]|uniref:adult-specific cuticular protein ACP-20-like n=1 Tax=Pollicipes pollicipes TaxID=41117 RepID=UPI001884FDA1|nr:adult-specific cuticular protein ACP-20-like [Pollicipes pollicipes]
MKFLALFAAIAATASAQGYGHGVGYGAGHGGGRGGVHGGRLWRRIRAPRAYAFEYAVEDPHYGPKFRQSEHNDGKTAQGYYSVALPDGRTQHVKYYADQAGYGGYNAEVTYTGYAQHAQPAHKY